ncbi:hypothetical protein DV454_003033 [Geotrichum candidum]|nr:hypothetical protein DV454_003033 [Geotrichum candidum]
MSYSPTTASALRSASVTPSIRVSATASSTPQGAAGTQRPRQTATSRRHALREFYKLAQQGQADAAAKGSQDQGSNSSNDSNFLISDSSSSLQSKKQPLETTEAETEEEKEVSLETLVQTSDLKALLRHENYLALEIRELDSEGKALVYNNYSKLTKASAVLAGISGVDSSGLGNEAKAAAAAAAAAAAGDREAESDTNNSDANDDAILEQTRQWLRVHAAAETRALIAAGDRARAEELIEKIQTLLASDRFTQTGAAAPWKEAVLAELTDIFAASPEPES